MASPAIVPAFSSQGQTPANGAPQAAVGIPHSSDNAPESAKPRTCFDLLDKSCLRNIIRHLSQFPRRVDWACSLLASDVLMLYTLDGKLSDVARKMFSQVSVWPHFSMNKQGDYYNYDPQELCLNLQFPDSDTFAKIIAKADPYPTLLAFMEVPSTPLTCRLWSNLSVCIEPVKALHILGTPEPPLFDLILAAVGPRLNSLGVRCDRSYIINSVARHCPSIVDLTLYERHVNLDPIWDTIGPSLLSLTLEHDLHDGEVIRAIQTRCRALIKLDVYAQWDRRCLNPSISYMYASYGKQLQYANLFTMLPWDYRRVVDSCPNVECTASFTEFFEEGLLVKEGLESVGPALAVAAISIADDRMMVNGLAEAANMCRNLREVKIDQLKLDALNIISALFSLPKFGLKILSVSDVHRDSRAMLGVIANNTGALTKFTYNGFMTSQETVLGIRGVVCGNPNLLHLEINLEGQEVAEPVNVYASSSEDEFSGTAYDHFRGTSVAQYENAAYLEMGETFRSTAPEVNVDKGMVSVDLHNIDRDPDTFTRAARNIDRELAEECYIDRRIPVEEQREVSSVGEEEVEVEDDEVYYEPVDTPSDRDLVEFVRTVYPAVNLTELTIQIPHHLVPDPPLKNLEIANACRPLRVRRLHVCIASYYYLH